MAHLNAAGITRLVTKLKERFAALAHTHAAATDITGQLPVANGGTGASTASGARTNLDAAQDNSSGITLADAGSNISTLLATTGIASTPSGKTLQGQISTLQDSVSPVDFLVTYASGVTNADTSRCQYKIIGKIVSLHVVLKITASGGIDANTTLLNVPVSCRPERALYQMVYVDGAVKAFYLLDTGVLRCTTALNKDNLAWINLVYIAA